MTDPNLGESEPEPMERYVPFEERSEVVGQMAELKRLQGERDELARQEGQLVEERLAANTNGEGGCRGRKGPACGLRSAL